MYQTSNNYKSKIYEASTKHLLRIFINSTEIDSKYILDCKPSHILFGDGTFSLGSVSCKGIDLKLYKTAVPNTINSVYITSGITGEEIPVGYFNVDSISKDDDYTVTLKLLDNMIKFEVNYDASQLTYPCTLIQILQDICTTCGVELGTNTFLGSSREVSVFDNSISARTYVSYIAEQAGGFAFIGRDGKLYIKTIGESTGTLDIKYFKNFKWGDKFKISKVVYNGLATYEAGTDTNNTIYINPENMYINSQAEITNIYNQIKDLEVYSFSGDSIIDPALDIGDLLSIDGRNVIYQGTMDYGGKWKAGITSDIQSKEQEDTTSRTFSQTLINRVTEEAINNITNTESTKEGNPIMIDDSTEEPIIRLEVDGHSEQATRSGKNIYNIFDINNVSGLTVNNDGWATATINNSSGASLIILNLKVPTTNLINVSTNYALFLEIETVSGQGFLCLNESSVKSQFQTERTLSLSTLTANSVNKYIMTTRNNFESSTNMFWSYLYAEAGKSCSIKYRLSVLADTSITTDDFVYEPYGVSPSPDYPSEIHSVADDVNLFDIGVKGDYRSYTDGSTINWLTVGNDKLSIVVQADGTTMCYNSKQYLGNKTYTITAKTSMARGRLYVKLRNSSDTGWLTNNDVTISSMSYNSYYGGWFIQSETNITLILTINIPDCLYCCFGFGFASDNVGTTQTIQEIKIQEGTEVTPYSPYNQGTVTIKQENIKNYLNWDKFIYYSNWTNSNSPGYKSFEITGLNINKTYTLCRTDTAGYGETSKYAGFNKGNNNGNMFLHSTDSSRNLQSVSDTPSEDGKIYITMYMSSQSDLNDYINIIKKCWVIEGNDYEPYQGNDYTIQTEPLRSIPNGTKDTLEEDGIHKKIRILNLKISDMNNSEDYPGWNNVTQIAEDYPNKNSGFYNAGIKYLCNICIESDGTVADGLALNTLSGNKIIYLPKTFHNLTQSQWIAQYPDLVVQIQYEIPEEVIEPFTDKQQNVIDSIETNLYTQYFSSPTNMRITYLRENGLTDTYETKQNASKKYAEIKIETDKIDLKVAKDDVIGSINLSSEEASINASKINLNGVVTANQNFKILNDGSMEAKNGKFTGGTIDLSSSADGTSANSVFKIYDTNNPNDVYTYIYPRRINLEENGNYLSLSTEEGMSLIDLSENYTYEDEGGNEVTITFQSIDSVQVDDDNTLAMRKGQFVYRADAPGYPMHYIEMQGKEDGCKLVIGDTINAEETTIEASKMTYGTEGLYAPHRYGVRFDKYGNLVLKENNENNSCAWGIFDENGNRRFKVVFNNGHVENSDEDGNGVFAAGGGTIYFRPNGTENTSSQAFIDSSGNFYLSSESFIKGYCGSTAINLIRAYNNMTALGDSNYETGIWGSAFRIYPSSYFSAYCQFNDSVDINANLYVNNHSIRAKDIYDNNTVTNATNMYITSNGWIRRTTNTSSKEYKENIKDIQKNELNPERLYDLEIKQFKYKDQYQPNEKDSRYNKELIGFIAEDLEKIYPIAVDYSEDGKIDNWNERYIIPAMLKLIQNQKKEIDNLKERLDRLEKGN